MPNIKQLYAWLKTGLEPDPDQGIFVADILETFNFCANNLSSDFTLQANTFSPLFEGFAYGLDWQVKFEERKNKGGRIVRGISYKDDSFVKLHNIVNTGVIRTTNRFTQASTLAKTINTKCRKTADLEKIDY